MVDSLHMRTPVRQRNWYLDFLRGIGALCIIAIHTCFYSGAIYTPEWFKNLTLFFDVPLFFYLSGMGSSYSNADIGKSARRILNIWMQYVYFITVVALFCVVSRLLPSIKTYEGCTDIKDLINCYMFKVSIPGFPVISDSIWFMPVYFRVVIVNTIVLMVIEPWRGQFEFGKVYMWLLLGFFIYNCFHSSFMGNDIRFFLFYSFIWMLGRNKMCKTNRTWSLGVALLFIGGGFCFSSYLLDLKILDIQNAKFPPSLKYLCASLPIIYLVRYRECNFCANNRGGWSTDIFTHVGRNAIWYYFCQGIGSTILYSFRGTLSGLPWFVEFIVMLLINITVSSILAEALRITFNHTISLIKKMDKNIRDSCT